MTSWLDEIENIDDFISQADTDQEKNTRLPMDQREAKQQHGRDKLALLGRALKRARVKGEAWILEHNKGGFMINKRFKLHLLELDYFEEMDPTNPGTI